MHTDMEDKKVHIPAPPPQGRPEDPDRIAKVRRRLLAGELDTERALVETAFALIDGDLPHLILDQD